MKIWEIIDRVIAYHPPMRDDPEHPTCDVVKYGDPTAECTGIAVSCYGSVEVIRQTIEMGANLLIVHEPLFWSDEEKTEDLTNSSVFQEKKALLDQGKITVWRDHDHIHGGSPFDPPLDGIYVGIMKELGWEPYLIGDPRKPLLFQIPETTGEALGRYLMEKLGLQGLRIVGDPYAAVSKVFLWEHIRENDWNGAERRKLLAVDGAQIDAVIPLETIDWTVMAYIRDAAQLGHPKIIYNPGHFNLEELGMRHFAKCLPAIIDESVPVQYVFGGDSFGYLLPEGGAQHENAH